MKQLFEQLQQETQWLNDYANNVSHNHVLRLRAASIEALVKEIKSKLETK